MLIFTGSAFEIQMAQFKYTPLKGANGLRRSPRVTSPSTSTLAKSTSTSPPLKKRSWQRMEEDANLKIEQEFESEPATPSSSFVPTSSKKRRSTTKQRSAQDPYNPVNNLTDSLRPGLTLVCIGLNPGLMTAATGHAYAHPSNRFWHLLFQSGVTPRKHLPSETRDLMDLYQIGNTNICARPTRSGDGLSKEEMEEGAVLLDRKIALYKPEAVVIVGKSIWEAIWRAKKGQKKFNNADFCWGWQGEDMQLGRTRTNGQLTWEGARTFVATSTSGLAANLSPAEKLAIWKPLGQWITAKREEVVASKAG